MGVYDGYSASPTPALRKGKDRLFPIHTGSNCAFNQMLLSGHEHQHGRQQPSFLLILSTCRLCQAPQAEGIQSAADTGHHTFLMDSRQARVPWTLLEFDKFGQNSEKYMCVLTIFSKPVMKDAKALDCEVLQPEQRSGLLWMHCTPGLLHV